MFRISFKAFYQSGRTLHQDRTSPDLPLLHCTLDQNRASVRAKLIVLPVCNPRHSKTWTKLRPLRVSAAEANGMKRKLRYQKYYALSMNQRSIGCCDA